MGLEPSVQAKFAELADSAAPPGGVAHLRRLVEHGDDLACYKINAFHFAADSGLTRVDAVRTLLYATRLGLLDLNYDVFCPSCNGVPEYTRALMGVRNRSHCELCRLDIDVDFEEQLEVTFTTNPSVRTIAFKDFAARTENPDRVGWIKAMNAREGRTPALSAFWQPGEVRTESVDLAPGEYSYRLPAHLELGGLLVVEGAPAHEKQALRIAVDARGAVSPRSATLRPGPVEITVEYGFPSPWAFVVAVNAIRNNFVSAAYVTAQQEFRDLFSGEFLAPDVSFAIRTITLMFTDIKGSTEMYEALGDAKAYRRVRDHFDVMTGVIRRHEGGIVKTIGDAVMAAFPVNSNAVAAACEIQRAFATMADPLAGIEVKIGLHRGPTIAVTTNRNLDYFGRTVNIAARVQGKSQPRQVFLSAAVLDDPAVASFVAREQLRPREVQAELKGIAGAHTLWAIEPSPSVATAS